MCTGDGTHPNGACWNRNRGVLVNARQPTGPEVERIIAELVDILNDLQHGAVVWAFDESGRPSSKATTPNLTRLMLLVSAAYRDGFRSSTRATDGSPSSVTDDEGNPVPPRSDPTGELVIQRRVSDPMWEQAASVWQALTHALGDLRVARGSMIKAFEGRDEEPDEPGCVNCQRVASWVPVHRSERCRWCYDFWLAEGFDAPDDLLKVRASGRPVTQRMVTQARPAKAQRRSTRRKAR